MTGFDRRGATVDRAPRQRARGPRFGDLSDRLARAFVREDPSQRTVQLSPPPGGPIDDFEPSYADSVLPRFPITRQGYECGAVDEHLAELEEELASLEGEVEDLRTQVPSNNTVAAEIERIGEQTSAVLLAAHDEAQQTIRAARAQANDCISDAAAYAVELTEQAKRELTHAEVERTAVMRERERLLEDIRLTAAELVSLADNATARVAPEPVIASPEQWVEDEQLQPGEDEEGTTEN